MHTGEKPPPKEGYAWGRIVQKNEHSFVTNERSISFLLKNKDLGFTLFGFSIAHYRRRSWSSNFGSHMDGHSQDRVDEHRAAILLGIPESELRRYSQVSGLGHIESDDKGQKLVFTYEELRRICLLVAQSPK